MPICALDALDVLDRLAERHARRQVERQRHRRKLAEMVFRKRHGAARDRGDRGQRHQRAQPARDRWRICRARWSIGRLVRRQIQPRTARPHRAGIAAAVPGSPCTGRWRCRSAKSAGRRTPRPARSSICAADTPSVAARSRLMATFTDGVDRSRSEVTSAKVGSLRHRVLQPVRRRIKLVGIGALQRVLVFGLGAQAADVDRGRVAQEHVDAGNAGQLRPQLVRSRRRRRGRAPRAASGRCACRPNSRPTRTPPAPTTETTPRTLGSARAMSATSCWWRTMSANEMPFSASVLATI